MIKQAADLIFDVLWKMFCGQIIGRLINIVRKQILIFVILFSESLW